ncbi:hypothetical protein BDF14DRAFT_1964132 [Spinellus fusiger]|nr:hypothetical protein BDF14DRAFT_1964132 [Spinellus fusiger]
MLNQQATSLNKQPPTSTISIDENECIVNELPCKHPLVEKTSSTNKKVRIQPTEKAKTVETETQPKKNVALVEASTQSTEVVEIESTMDTVSDIPSMNAMNIANIINTVDTTNTKDTLDTVKPHTLAASAFMNPPIIEQSAIQRKDESIPVQTLLPIYLSTQYTDINERIEDEKLTLTRLREALDIKLTFHAAQNHPALFHKIQRSLCTSTRKNITIAHIAKIMYLVPELYLVHAKALRELGRTVEAYLIEFGKQWMSPLSGKDLQDRKDILALKIKVFFSRNSGHDATVPEAVLPKIETVVDTSKLLERANLPPSVRAVLERQEQRKEAAKAALVEKPKVVGTVKDRASALLERVNEIVYLLYSYTNLYSSIDTSKE